MWKSNLVGKSALRKSMVYGIFQSWLQQYVPSHIPF